MPMLPEPVNPGGSSSLGPHQTADVLSCPRKWQLRYGTAAIGQNTRLVALGEPAARLIGTLIHMHLAYWYASMMETPPAWYRAMTLQSQLDRLGTGRPIEMKIAEDCAATYRQIAIARPWKPLEVEREFYEDLPEGRYTARIDLVVQIGDKVWAVDHKSTRGRGQSLDRWRDDGEFALDWQMLTIANLMIKHYGQERFGGVLINRLKHSSPMDFDFHRLPLPAPAVEATRDTIARSLLQREEFKKRLSAGEHLPAHFHACWSKYGACDYFNLCRAPSRDARQTVRQYEFKLETIE